MERLNNSNEGPLTGLLREQLYAPAACSQAREELEKRKLISVIESECVKATSTSWLTLHMRGVVGFAGAGIVLLLIGMFFLWNENASFSLDGLWVLKRGDYLSQGHVAAVTEDDGAKLLLEDKTCMWFSGASVFSLHSPEGKHVYVSKGSVLVDVTPQHKRKTFSIGTPHGQIVVHGTVFAVTVSELSTSVRLYEGRVSLKGKKGEMSLEIGHAASLSLQGTRQIGPIGRIDAMGDLMIVEKTAHLAGPSIPSLDVPEPMDSGKSISPKIVITPSSQVDSDDLSLDESPVSSKAVGKKERPIREKQIDTELPPSSYTFKDPRLEQIEVTNQYKDEEEQLFIEAYHELKEGNHSDGRKLLESYLSTYPEGRYWRRVKDILGE